MRSASSALAMALVPIPRLRSSTIRATTCGLMVDGLPSCLPAWRALISPCLVRLLISSRSSSATSSLAWAVSCDTVLLSVPSRPTMRQPSSLGPADLFGVEISGSCGPVYVADSYFIPQHWFAVVATAGPNSLLNPIGVRQHPDAAYQGLRSIPGPVPGYPLQESFYTRGVGVGTRHRGAAVVCQVTSAAQYTPPTLDM